MKIGRGNRSTRRKPAPAPLCPPQIPLDQPRDRTQAAAVGSQRLTAWAMAGPRHVLLLLKLYWVPFINLWLSNSFNIFTYNFPYVIRKTIKFLTPSYLCCPCFISWTRSLIKNIPLDKWSALTQRKNSICINHLFLLLLPIHDVSYAYSVSTLRNKANSVRTDIDLKHLRTV
jgi:hypothetical protein